MLLTDQTVLKSIDAEEAALGSLLLCPQLFDELAAEIRAEDFADDATRAIYEAAAAIQSRGDLCDVLLLAKELHKRKRMEIAGGAANLAKLMHVVPTHTNARYYAKIVREAAERRRVVAIASKASNDAADPAAEVATTIATMQTELAAMEQRGTSEPTRSPELVRNVLAELEARFAGNAPRGVSTGFADLDDKLGGFRGSQLIVLAGRPSMGKSALAMNIAANIAKDGGGVLVVSLEMSSVELSERMIVAEGRVNGKRLRSGSVDIEDRRRIQQAAAKLAGIPLAVMDAPFCTIRDIAGRARIEQRRGGLSLLVIDYLQLIEPENPKDPRQEQVAKMARRLKRLAKELDVPTLCLAQLNRESEKAADRRPMLSNLRESGAIEQDADVVMFVHREEYYDRKSPDLKGKAEVIIAKQRSGPCGVVPLTFIDEFCAFGNSADPRRFEGLDAYNRGDDDSFEDGVNQ